MKGKELLKKKFEESGLILHAFAVENRIKIKDLQNVLENGQDIDLAMAIRLYVATGVSVGEWLKNSEEKDK